MEKIEYDLDFEGFWQVQVEWEGLNRKDILYGEKV